MSLCACLLFRFAKKTNETVLDVSSREAVRAAGSGGHDGLSDDGVLVVSLPTGVQRHDHQRERQVERGEEYGLHASYICVSRACIRRVLTLAFAKRLKSREGILFTRGRTPVTG